MTKKISLHTALEEKFGISKITNKKQLRQLVAELRKGGDKPIEFIDSSKDK